MDDLLLPLLRPLLPLGWENPGLGSFELCFMVAKISLFSWEGLEAEHRRAPEGGGRIVPQQVSGVGGGAASNPQPRGYWEGHHGQS